MADVATVAELFADKYEVVAKLDWNGLALVYKARRENGEPLAVAMLPIDTESSPEAAQIFKSKASELQLLVEPGIVRVTGHGVQHGVPYLELEYVDATTLADELLDGPLDRDQAFALTSELLDTLGRAHAGGHFHWDLTPSNILLAPGLDGTEHAFVVGFGIQQIIRASFDPEKTGPTGRGSGPKAKRYLAPELQDARQPDARADVFGVAAVLHHMLTGSPPGPESPAPPADLADALAEAMSPDPNGRPGDAATFGFTLAEGVSGGSDSPSFAPPARSMPAFSPPATAPAPTSPALEAEVAPPPAAPEATPAPEPPAAEAPAPDEPAALPSVTDDVVDYPTDATVVDAPVLSEHEITARVDEPAPPPMDEVLATEATPPEPAPEMPAAAEDADYESLGPPATATAEETSNELEAILRGSAAEAAGEWEPGNATTTPAPAQSPFDAVTTPAPAPAPATPPADPLAAGAPSAPKPAADPFAPSTGPGPIAKNPFEGEEFVEQEKKTGNMIAAIIVLTIAIGLAITFFVIRASS